MDNLSNSTREMVDHSGDGDVAIAMIRSARPAAARPVVATSAAGSGWYHDAAIAADRREAIERRCNPYRG